MPPEAGDRLAVFIDCAGSEGARPNFKVSLLTPGGICATLSLEHPCCRAATACGLVGDEARGLRHPPAGGAAPCAVAAALASRISAIGPASTSVGEGLSVFAFGRRRSLRRVQGALPCPATRPCKRSSPCSGSRARRSRRLPRRPSPGTHRRNTKRSQTLAGPVRRHIAIEKQSRLSG